jgi:dTDP-4-amino-4,6-dideoxygalactose transaminase
MSFNSIHKFEQEIAGFFGSPYAVAVDCCTHALELSLILTNAKRIKVPNRTYVSVPFLSRKLGIGLEWSYEDWSEYYYITDRVIDAAVLWRRDSYLPGTFMCVSFQFRKHLSLGRGGVILTDDKDSYDELKKLSYDGRLPDQPWATQNIASVGYHYYMTPETAELGLSKLPDAIAKSPEIWTIDNWPDLTQMDVFK